MSHNAKAKFKGKIVKFCQQLHKKNILPTADGNISRRVSDLEFEKVGGEKTFRVDVRSILATNDDLGEAVREGRFRQDLFFRINVINIDLPPLRDRSTDIPLLAEHFMAVSSEELGKQAHHIAPEAMKILQQYAWPGNVRELQNVISRAILLGSSETIGPEDLPANLTSAASFPTVRSTGQTLKEALEGPERQIILDVLQANGWNRNATADTLGINRTTLYKKMKRLGLDEPRKSVTTTMPTGAISLPPTATL